MSMNAIKPETDEGLVLRFWGVRGSTPVSGPEYVEFGGSTPCLEIRLGERLFVLDAGSGIGAFGRAYQGSLPQDIDILFSHLHTDHTAGLPFFKPAVFDATRTLNTWCGNLDGQDAREAIERMFSPPLFPITLDKLMCKLRHRGFKAGESLDFPGGIRVGTILLNHPQGSVGYRFEHGGKSLCVISDIEHTDPWPDPELARFVAGADLMVYDGMFTEGEYCRCAGWGHSTWQKGVELAKAAGVKSLAIIHLHPAHTDAQLREVEAQMQAVMPTAFIARERQTVNVGAAVESRPQLALARTG